jgi:hypothetical protein
MGHSMAQLVGALRYTQKVAGSIPDRILGIFQLPNSSCSTTALGSTQPLTKMSTRDIPWGIKAAGA